MALKPTFRPYELAIAVIERNSKGTVIDRSLQRFTCKEQYEEFKYSLAPEHLTAYELHDVHLREAQAPDRPHKSKKDMWCPYCATWRVYFKRDGYTRCEICEMSTGDFWFVKYNRGFSPSLSDPTPKTDSSDLSSEEKRRLRRERRKARKARGGK